MNAKIDVARNANADNTELCCVCNLALCDSPDGESGYAQGEIGWMPVCSDACTTEFYAEDEDIVQKDLTA